MQNAIPRQWCLLRTARVLAALIAGAASGAADITFETRAMTGTDGPLGPGLGAGVSFGVLGDPALNGAGQTAFAGTLTGPGVTIMNNRGIWSEGGGSGLALVAREGNQAPGTDVGVNFNDFEPPVFNGAGQIAFAGTLTGPGVTSINNRGIWSEGGGLGLALIARAGSQAPGRDAGENFIEFAPLVLNGVGQTAFKGNVSLTGPGATMMNSIWSEGGGSGLALVVGSGSQAPGTDAGVNFSSIFSPALNGAGQTAFLCGLSGSGVDGTNNEGIWSEGGGSGLTLVARSGDQAPGTAAGVYFSSLGSPVINGAGQTAFVGTLTGSGVTTSNFYGIWSEGGGSGLALVAQSGNQAPGTAAGVNFFYFSLVLNGAGPTAFKAGLTGPGVTTSNSSGIWSEGGGSGLALVARTGDKAPGTIAGVNFGSDLNDFTLNGAGQIAFRCDLTGPEADSSNNRGIWATDINGLLHLIARKGDLFDVNDDPILADRRTILTLSLVTGSGGEDGRPTSFNDAGQLAFRASFTDGSSGIFVATIAAPFKITITPAIAPATGYDFTWYSRPGKVYDLVSSTDLVTPVAEWPVHAAYGDIHATGTTTTLTAVPVDGPQRFFAVIEKDAP